MGKIVLYVWFRSFFLVTLIGSLLSALAVESPRYLTLPVTYTEWVFHTALPSTNSVLGAYKRCAVKLSVVMLSVDVMPGV